MALRKGKVDTNQETIDKEVQQSKAAEETEASEDMPFDGGTPANEGKASSRSSKEALGETAEESEPSTQVAPSDDKQKALAEVPKKGGVMADLADDGFEGLELGFGSFPIIALKNEGEFEDTEGGSYDEEFECVIQGTRTKYVIKNTKCTNKQEEVIYSYDGVTDTNDQPVQNTIDEWADSGWGYETKAYLEVTAILVDEERNMGEMVLLSIPKTSTKRLSGYIAQNRMRRRLLPSQYITRCVVGEKITNVDFPFYPWKFEFVETLM